MLQFINTTSKKNRTKYWILLVTNTKMCTWKPDLMLATEHLDPHVSHCKKNSLVSFWRMVSGDRQVWHVTYSLMYLKYFINVYGENGENISCVVFPFHGRQNLLIIIYLHLLRTFSICFCWNLPLMISWLLPSTEPLVPNSASRKSNRCFCCLCSIRQISVKFAKDVFFVPMRTTWGGLMTNFCFLPATMSGFLSRMISNTRLRSSSYV